MSGVWISLPQAIVQKIPRMEKTTHMEAQTAMIILSYIFVFAVMSRTGKITAMPSNAYTEKPMPSDHVTGFMR